MRALALLPAAPLLHGVGRCKGWHYQDGFEAAGWHDAHIHRGIGLTQGVGQTHDIACVAYSCVCCYVMCGVIVVVTLVIEVQVGATMPGWPYRVDHVQCAAKYGWVQ